MDIKYNVGMFDFSVFIHVTLSDIKTHPKYLYLLLLNCFQNLEAVY